VRERRQLACDGMVTPVVTISEATGALEAPPEIVTRGLIGTEGANGADGFVRKLQSIVTEAVENAPAAERRDTSLLKERVRLELKRYIQKQTGSRPIITPVVVQV
jgi:ribonuclease J